MNAEDEGCHLRVNNTYAMQYSRAHFFRCCCFTVYRTPQTPYTARLKRILHTRPCLPCTRSCRGWHNTARFCPVLPLTDPHTTCVGLQPDAIYVRKGVNTVHWLRVEICAHHRRCDNSQNMHYACLLNIESCSSTTKFGICRVSDRTNNECHAHEAIQFANRLDTYPWNVPFVTYKVCTHYTVCGDIVVSLLI